MPYNFETTFTQPILAELNSGRIRGASDWARSITRHYINTIKLGLPQNVPITLPAPGLNPTTPPPFTIGASGFSTANVKFASMYNVLYNYFLIRELKLEKGSIDMVLMSIKKVKRDIKNEYQKIKNITNTISLLNKQISELPILINDISDELRLELNERIGGLFGVFSSLNGLKVQTDTFEFNNLFLEEKRIIDTLKSFKFDDANAILQLSLYISNNKNFVGTAFGNVNDDVSFKLLVRNKLIAIIQELLSLIKFANDPSSVVDFINTLSNDRVRLKRLNKKIQQIAFIKSYVQPRLDLLQTKINEINKNIDGRLQVKLNNLTKLYQKKLTGVKESKLTSIYNNASQTIKTKKKQIDANTKKIREELKKQYKLLKRVIMLIAKSTALAESIKLEFDDIRNEIIGYQSIQNDNFSNVSTLSLDSLNISVNINNVNKSFNLNNPTTYATSLGLGSFGNIVTQIIVDTKCSVQTFRLFFQRKRSKVDLYKRELNAIKLELNSLIAEYHGTTKKVLLPTKTNNTYFIDLIKSYIYVVDFELNGFKAAVEDRISKLESKLDAFVNSEKKKLEEYAISLIPVNHEVADITNKAALVNAKKEKIKRFKETTKKYANLGTCVIKMSSAVSNVLDNIRQEDYSFTENQNAFNMFVDNYVKYKILKGGDSGYYTKEGLSYKEKFKNLIIVDVLITSIIATWKDIQNQNLVPELQLLKDQLGDAVGDDVRFLTSLFATDISNTKGVIDLLNNTTNLTLNTIDAKNKLLQLELKYMAKSRNTIITLLDIKDATKLSNSTITKLKNIKNRLDKKQSFILEALNLLQAELVEFKTFIQGVFDDLFKPIELELDKLKKQAKTRFEKQISQYNELLVNIDAITMSAALGLSARLFWSGASWTGSTGTTHTVLSILPFKPIKALSVDGPSKMIREIAQSFEQQLVGMVGFLQPPPNTGIPPISFVGYK